MEGSIARAAAMRQSDRVYGRDKGINTCVTFKPFFSCAGSKTIAEIPALS